MIDIDNLCPGCMTERRDSSACPSCGDESRLNSSPQALPIRTVLNDRFLIGRVLGRPGGFGITYLAFDLKLQTTAAIKEFLPTCSVARQAGNLTVIPNSKEDQTVFSEGLDMFLGEARTLARFSHPNITRIRDYFSANNTAYLIMEYHKGKPLDQYLREHKKILDEDQALEIMLPVLDGLKAVHEENFLHRDIKPQNIYMTENQCPILLDFGAARYAVGNKTSTLTVMLTSGFAPFEQYHRKGAQGPWTDLYASAATLYYLTTGKVPPDAIERRHQDLLIAPIRLNSGLSETFNFAVLKALSIDYRERPKRVEHFLNLLLGGTRAAPTTGLSPKSKAVVGAATPAPPTANYPQRISQSARATVIRAQAPPGEESKSYGKFLFGLLIIIAILIWKPAATTARRDHDIPTPITQNPSPAEAKPTETEVQEPEITLSYANIPPLEAFSRDFPQSSKTLDQDNANPLRTSDPKPLPSPSLDPRPAQSGDPELALQACVGSGQGQACGFQGTHRSIRGRCGPTPNGQLACMPEPRPVRSPPPPLRNSPRSG